MKAPVIYKLQESIGRFMQIRPTSEARLATIPPSTHANTSQKLCTLFLRGKERLRAYTKQCTESYVNIYLCTFLLQIIIIHIQVVTEIEEVGWVMEGTLCAEDYIFFMEK